MEMEMRVEALRVEERRLRPTEHSLRARVHRTDSLTQTDISQMHHLFCSYYENHSRERFQQDLFEKNHVILLRDNKSQKIQGFSTLLRVKIATARGAATGVFSGDTVVAKEYWGSAALGLAFLKYLWFEKIKNPMQPLYWFLISKGFKTYLLMANNFSRHYPRYESSTPEHYQQIMDEFYSEKFGSAYDAKSGLIVPDGPSCQLKGEVAPITPEISRLPRVAFFASRNKRWSEGVELVCMAEMNMLMPLKYGIKKLWKKVLHKGVLQ